MNQQQDNMQSLNILPQNENIQPPLIRRYNRAVRRVHHNDFENRFQNVRRELFPEEDEGIHMDFDNNI
jgi:hypothetical protein